MVEIQAVGAATGTASRTATDTVSGAATDPVSGAVTVAATDRAAARVALPTRIVLLATLLIILSGFGPNSAGADDQMRRVNSFQPIYFAELQDIVLTPERLYAFGVGGLSILDRPWLSLVGRYMPEDADVARYYRGAVSSGFVYVGARDGGLRVIDVTNETAPDLAVGIEPGGAFYEGMAVRAGYLYAAHHTAGIAVFDLSDPASPQPVTAVTELVNSWDIVWHDDFALIADGAGGLAVLDVSDIAAPQYLYSLPTSGIAIDIAVAENLAVADGLADADDLAVVACGSAGVDVFDVSDPLAAQWLGNYGGASMALSVAVTGDTLYVADWDDVEVVDLSEPVSPSRLGWENTPGRAMGLAAEAGRAYVADWGSVQVYEFGPTMQGDIDLPLRQLSFGIVPVGESVPLTFPVVNTGGGTLQVTSVETFNANFVVEPPSSFAVAPDATHEVTVTYTPAQPGYDATFVRIESNDPDESFRVFAASADDNPNYLAIGGAAPGFTFLDLDGNEHSLSDYLGQVVVLAFFSNW